VVYSVRVSVTTPAMAPAAPRVRAAIEKRIVMEWIELIGMVPRMFRYKIKE
jgi:hypothetical protein